MKKTFWIALLVAALTYGGRLAWRAHHDLVTLEVHDADLAQVVRQLRWQTWEPIYAARTVSGKVTLKVRNQPLEVVLDILNEQVNGRWTAVYPLYTSRRSLQVAQALAQGDIEPPVAGWTQWNARPSGSPAAMGAIRGPGPEGGPGGRSARGTVTASFTNLPPLEVASVIRRHTGARVIPEDGTSLPVTLQLDKATADTAVAAVARKTFRKWTRFYVIEGRPSGPGQPPAEFTGTGRESQPNRPPRPTDEEREAMRQQMAADPARQEQAVNRMMSGLLNSTPAQRAERDQMRLARQKSQARR